MAPMYAVAKHGVVGAVRSFAKPLEAEGIRINALCPNCIGMIIGFHPFFLFILNFFLLMRKIQRRV